MDTSKPAHGHQWIKRTTLQAALSAAAWLLFESMALAQPPTSETDQSATLLPGTYCVSASAGLWGHGVRQIPVDRSGKVTKLHDLTTFYPAALSLADAQPVSVTAGQEQPDIDIRMQRGPTLSVKGTIAGGTGSLSKYSVTSGFQDGWGATSVVGTILPSGEFTFPELPPGKHELRLLEEGTSGQHVVGKTEVNLTDEDLTGVVIAAFKPAKVRMRVVIEGEEDRPLTAGTVSLMPSAGSKYSDIELLQDQPGAVHIPSMVFRQAAILHGSTMHATAI
jgi:hypothetical protein